MMLKMEFALGLKLHWSPNELDVMDFIMVKNHYDLLIQHLKQLQSEIENARGRR